MADNVAITAGSGTNIATDDVAGVHFQRMKLVDGTLDATTAIAAGGGGGAGARDNSGTNQSGGNGAAGYVRLYESPPVFLLCLGCG